MKTDNTSAWILAGYERFALAGYAGLKIEPLAKHVGKSKSSFYHHFADQEVFMDTLLRHHLAQSARIADQERQAPRIDPDLIHILVAHKTDLLFNRQLRIHQNIPAFADTLHQSSKIIGDAFKMAWARELNLNLSARQLEGVFSLATENFYLQINAENLHHAWLSDYFANLKRIASQLV